MLSTIQCIVYIVSEQKVSKSIQLQIKGNAKRTVNLNRAILNPVKSKYGKWKLNKRTLDERGLDKRKLDKMELGTKESGKWKKATENRFQPFKLPSKL